MTNLQVLTLFFHCYKWVFIAILVLKILLIVTDNYDKDKDKSSSLDLLYWVLFIMSWYF